MSEAHIPAICTDDEFRLAQAAGIDIRTNLQELAVHQFATAIRAQETAKRNALVEAVKALIRQGHLLNSYSVEWNAVHAALDSMKGQQ